MFHNDIVEKFNFIIVDIKKEEYKSTESNLTSYKAIFILKGNMSLRVKEIREGTDLIKYSYYFLNSNNNIIYGWDNAPHHDNINTFPHHKHIKNNSSIEESSVRNLSDVLEILKKYFEKL